MGDPDTLPPAYYATASRIEKMKDDFWEMGDLTPLRCDPTPLRKCLCGLCLDHEDGGACGDQCRDFEAGSLKKRFKFRSGS